MPTEKPCTRCGEVKSLDLFATRKDARDGKSPWCKACFRSYSDDNADLLKAQKRAWNAAHPDYFKHHYQRNRERRLAQVRAWHLANPEKRRDWWRRYAAENREKINVASRVYQRRTGHKYSKARELAKRTRVIEHVDRRVVYVRGRGRCGICGDHAEYMTFHIDHIIPLSRGGEHSYANTQPAHPFCNLSKGARVAA